MSPEAAFNKPVPVMSLPSTPENTLLVDIGGTHIRFYQGTAHQPMPDTAQIISLDVADYPSFETALADYFTQYAPKPKKMALGLSIAAPLSGDTVKLTNAHWEFSLSAIKSHFGFTTQVAFNDFAAVAYGIPALRPRHLCSVGPEGLKGEKGGAIAVIGPGTGLGMATLVHTPQGPIAIAGEGPHQTAPAKTQRELDVIGWLRHKYRHVSCERICSGKGLVNIYQALCGLSGGKAPENITPEAITAQAMDGDRLAEEALDIMLGFLGTIAGNHALLVGARGGVYIAGGIPLRLGDFFLHSRFRNEFEAKGRFEDYLKPIPTYLIDHPNVGILGLDWYLRQRYRADIDAMR